MDSTTAQSLYRFNSWANENLRQAIEGADEAAIRLPLDLWFGSAFKTLAHLVRAEIAWLQRLQSNQPLSLPSEFKSVAELVTAWREVDARWEAYVGTLSTDDLAEERERISALGARYHLPLWQPVVHVTYHSAEHRSEAAVALTKAGVTHGPQEFFVYASSLVRVSE